MQLRTMRTIIKFLDSRIIQFRLEKDIHQKLLDCKKETVSQVIESVQFVKMLVSP